MLKAGDDLKDNTKQTSLKKDDKHKRLAKDESELEACVNAC